VLALLGLAMVAGCDDSGIVVDPIGQPTTGSLVLTMEWPPNLVSARVLPGFAETMVVTVSGTGPSGTFTVNREATRADVHNGQASVALQLPAGSGHSVTVVAQDADGNPVGVGHASVSIKAGESALAKVSLVPLGTSGSMALPLVRSLSGQVTAWTGSFSADSDPPPGVVAVDLFGDGGVAEIARVTFIMHSADELWIVQCSGVVEGNRVYAESASVSFLRRIPLAGGGVCDYGGWTAAFEGSLASENLNLVEVDQAIAGGGATIDLAVAGEWAPGRTLTGTVVARAPGEHRLSGTFVCGTSGTGENGLPSVPGLVSQRGIIIDGFEGNFAPSGNGGTVTTSGVSARQLTFTGLNAMIFVDVFALGETLAPQTVVTMFLHNDAELWQLRGVAPVDPSGIGGLWVAPQQAVDYFSGFSNDTGGYTTDFTGKVLDFSLVSGGVQDPLDPTYPGAFGIAIPDDAAKGDRVTGTLQAKTKSGRILCGTFRGVVSF